MFDWGVFEIPGLTETAALAAVALIGYLFGQRSRSAEDETPNLEQQAEIDRATQIARKLESTAASLRTELADHHAKVTRFKRRLRSVQQEADDDALDVLCDEAEAILRPTLELANQLSDAYDQIRQQSNALLAFSDGRIDPLTGVGNGRALEEHLTVLLTSLSRGEGRFAVALVGLDHINLATTAARAGTDAILKELAELIQSTIRDRDFVARYGGDEFVITMPQTTLAGATVFGERLRDSVRNQLPTTICCGLTVATPGDDIKHLLGRADSALYSAKAAGTDRQFVHDGSQIRGTQNHAHPSSCASVILPAAEDPAEESAEEPAEQLAAAD